MNFQKKSQFLAQEEFHSIMLPIGMKRVHLTVLIMLYLHVAKLVCITNIIHILKFDKAKSTIARN